MAPECPASPVWQQPPWCPWHPCRRRHTYPTHTRRRWWWRRRQVCWWRVSTLDCSSSSDDEASVYHSDNETNMPGGFENSAMKSSFSLSSLQPSSASLETPDHARPERQYNSLRKTCRKDPEKDAWRRSWDRREDKDEFWNALKPNYLYLMDSHLIDSCKEAGRDLHYESSPSHDWSFDEFCTQFVELDQWLSSIQETIYSKEENVTDRNLRLSQLEEMHRKTYKRKIFNNQGGRLAARFPDRKEDVKWRVAHLNRKWERLEQTVTPQKRAHPDLISHAIDIEHELNCLKKWIRLTERRLVPINFNARWTFVELEIEAKKHQVIQQEVEFHGKIVCSVLKRCDRLVQVEAEATGSPVNLPSHQALRRARELERRWQHLFIRSLEWICHIENQTKRAKFKSPESVGCKDSDEEEPVHKHPRLSCSPWPDYPPTLHDGDDDYVMDVSTSSATNEMVGPQSPPTFTSPPPATALLSRTGSEEDRLNKNYHFSKAQFDPTRRQSVPLDAARKLFRDESSVFTSSDRPAQNCATFYFKHCDTESEQDEGGLMETDSNNMEELSDEEWTYKCGVEGEEDSPVQNDEGSLCQSTETLAESIPKPMPKPVLDKLIRKAEKIVQPASPTRRPREFQPLIFNSSAARAKSKVNDWLRDFDQEDSKMGESCDASGEYTTEEESHSSGDFNTSVVHCHHSTEILQVVDSPASSPASVVPNTPDLSKVVLRAKRLGGTPKRPLSESGLTQLPHSQDHLLHTRSESALNQIDTTPTQSVKMDTSVQGTLSSSTTAVEEGAGQTQEGSGGGYTTNSLRKRKIKHKKRNLGRKSDSAGSDSHDPSSPQKVTPTVRRPPASGTETEEEAEGECKLRAARRKQTTQPMFRLGPDGGAVTVFSMADKALSAESSFSELPSWDSYQEKYNSEAYSEEIADPRQLLNFGEDYRNFIDSQSDGASSISRPPGFHRRRRPISFMRSSALDSDSEGSGHFRNVINKSLSQLDVSELVWTRLSKTNPHLVMAKDFADIISTCKECKENIRKILDNFDHENEIADECQEIRGLIERWENLELKAEELQKVRSLQREMSALKEDLLELTKRVSYDSLEDRDHLEAKIHQVKEEQTNLWERKSRLIEVNSAVHKFFTDSGQEAKCAEAAAQLKEDVKELYLVWEESNKRVTQQLDSLSQLSVAWQSFESHLAELQVALRSDQKTLRMLDSALQKGPVSQDVASSVIDVAKVLSEKQDLCFKSVCALDSTTPVILSVPSSPEASLTDSGISDSGSEQESERERRLSTLRRLAKQLESVLSPNSQAIADMARRIQQTESELRGLQQTCRELIVKTAKCADPRVEEILPSLTPRSLVKRTGKKKSGEMFMELSPDDDDPDPDSGSGGWLWRVIRAALPFHVALLAIFCMVRLLEPQCCEHMNNLYWSFTPQLRYPNGPPPV